MQLVRRFSGSGGRRSVEFVKCCCASTSAEIPYRDFMKMSQQKPSDSPNQLAGVVASADDGKKEIKTASGIGEVLKKKLSLVPKKSNANSAVADIKKHPYTKWDPNARSESLNSLQAGSIPIQEVSVKVSKGGRGMPSKEEVMEELYLRQRAHALSDSCSSYSYTGADAGGQNARLEHRTFGRYLTNESMKRSGFYGACISAIILLSVFVVGLLVWMPTVMQALNELDERLNKFERKLTRGPGITGDR